MKNESQSIENLRLKLSSMFPNNTLFPSVFSFYIIIILILWFPASLFSKTNTVNDSVIVKSVWSQNNAHPGDRISLAIIFNIAEGYHINADEKQIREIDGFYPIPTTVSVINKSDKLTIEAVQFAKAVPVSVEFTKKKIMSFVQETVCRLPIKISAAASPGEELFITLRVQYQACDESTCFFPEQIDIEEKIKVAPENTVVMKINQKYFLEADQELKVPAKQGVLFDLFGFTFSINITTTVGFILLHLTAAFGGLLLNFTPCVLPIIPIKIISLSHAAAKKRKKCFILGVSMSVGIIVFWLIIGGAIAAFAGFTAINQLFQYPLFTILLGVVIGFMALGMCGLFNVMLPNFIYKIHPRQDTILGSFGLGIMTAILSTPCTAPFMGAAAAWAAIQKPIITLVTFSSIGAGMSFPYLVLSAYPNLVTKMPKSGPASELIKQLMGFFLLSAAAYFIGVGVSGLLVKPPVPPSKLYWWGAMFFCGSGGIWLTIRVFQITSDKVKRLIWGFIGIMLFAAAILGGVHLTDSGSIKWEYYTPAHFDKAVADKKIVVMVFTAEWCLNCKALEQSVLKSRSVQELLSAQDVVPMIVDFTGDNPDGQAKLKEVGRLTIPLLVIFATDGKPIFMSDFYTAEQLIDSIEQVRQTLKK